MRPSHERIVDRKKHTAVSVAGCGRFGVRHLGVTQGGALDWVSMSWANRLLGNRLDAAVVEITLGGLTRWRSGLLPGTCRCRPGCQLDERPLCPGAAFLFVRGSG